MNDDFITWDDNNALSKSEAISKFSENTEFYSGSSKSQGSHYRHFIDIEPSRSVKPYFGHNDYYAFRPNEAVPHKQRDIIKMCMDAYDKVGIIRNIIDLMGDFGSQGISIIHPNKSVEKFYQQWFKNVHGKERSERFLNNLYKCGNVIMYRSYANVTPQLNNYMKSLSSDIKVEIPNMTKNQIPWRYNFFNPLSITLKDGNISLFLGAHNYTINSSAFFEKFTTNGDIPAQILETLPANIKKAIKSGQREIPLDTERLCVYHYKKDDWKQWANPMIYAILDDIIMLEKMRLADLSALDGAISNIRLWTLGSLEHKILPNKGAINKLRDILSSNVGGGTMELVWGPELSFTESSSEVYKFLGSEKYTSVLNSIYAGLGVPPTLTGMATNGGGFTNNFISLKTLVERLQYGRDLLVQFWEKELEIVRKAMGFRYKAHIHFDQMTLSDEAAEKNLLIQLADRDIISHETLLERFKEIPQIENIRIKREIDNREDHPKAGPFHDAKHKQTLERIALQTGRVTPTDVGLKTSVDESILTNPHSPHGQPNQPNPPSPNGRPPFKKDESPRQERSVKPRSTPGVADLLYWSESAWSTVSEVLTSAYLATANKKNLRQLNKAQITNLENLKLDVFTNLQPFQEVNHNIISEILNAQKQTPKIFANLIQEKNIDINNMTIDNYRKYIVGLYVEHKIAEIQ
jgi:hypothetical protein